MRTPNPFKTAITSGRLQIGFWQSLGTSITAEISAHAGFDWLLIDGEHGPNTLVSIRDQLQVIENAPSHAVVRISEVNVAAVKQVMDAGAQTVLVPMVDTPAQAAEMARALRYPPAGNRGNGANVARVSGYGRNPDYLQNANAVACLLVQAETQTALDNLEDICAIDGVDGVFIGPSDLAASMGYLGQPTAQPVQDAIEDAIKRIVKSGKAAGILMGNETLARRYIELGALFVAVGSDVAMLTTGSTALATKYKRGQAPKTKGQVC